VLRGDGLGRSFVQFHLGYGNFRQLEVKEFQLPDDHFLCYWKFIFDGDLLREGRCANRMDAI